MRQVVQFGFILAQAPKIHTMLDFVETVPKIAAAAGAAGIVPDAKDGQHTNPNASAFF